MIGNDIVSLDRVRQNKRQERFAAKVLTEAEAVMLTGLDPSVKIALAWSLKEAAFKCYSRTVSHPFVPRWYELDQIESGTDPVDVELEEISGIQVEKSGAPVRWTCRVKGPQGWVKATALQTPDFIMAMATSDEEKLEDIHWGTHSIPTDKYPFQREAVRLAITVDLRGSNYIPAGAKVDYRHNANTAPELYINQIKTDIQVSFSHDDQFIAYAWMGEPCKN